MAVSRLRRISAAAVAVIGALRHQDAERDADMALVLEQAVVGALEQEIELIEAELGKGKEDVC